MGSNLVGCSTRRSRLDAVEDLIDRLPAWCHRSRSLKECLMTLSVDLFYSFRSPYSYLALPKTTKMVADYDVAVNLRPVYPLAVRVPGFFKKTNPKFLSY